MVRRNGSSYGGVRFMMLACSRVTKLQNVISKLEATRCLFGSESFERQLLYHLLFILNVSGRKCGWAQIKCRICKMD